MKKALKVLYVVFSLALIIYLALPSPAFPTPPSDSVQSTEPGDSEDLSVKRAYFTNYTREEAVEHYRNEFSINFLGLRIPSLRLNYPPEESQNVIRDQTRTTFLEEIVYPMRESFFVNGFESGSPSNLIEIDEVLWWQKLTVRYYPSNFLVREIVGLGVILGIWMIFSQSGKLIGNNKSK